MDAEEFLMGWGVGSRQASLLGKGSVRLHSYLLQGIFTQWIEL
jgi:hypothetical protein